MVTKLIIKQRDLFLYSKSERSDISLRYIMMLQLWVKVFTKIKSSDVRNYVF